MPNFRLQTPPGVGTHFKSFSRVSPHEKVALVDAAISVKAPAQPTNQDVLNAVNELSKKLAQISKNQQLLEAQIACIYNTAFTPTASQPMSIYGILWNLFYYCPWIPGN